jgi:thiol-disulfide isomerase/thioredoxin
LTPQADRVIKADIKKEKINVCFIGLFIMISKLKRLKFKSTILDVKKTAFFILAAVFLTILFVFNSNDPVNNFKKQVKVFEVIENQSFPEFTLYDLKDQRLSRLPVNNKYTLVNFWATWCAPCITELPKLLSLDKKINSKNFQVLYISLDNPPNASALMNSMRYFNIEDIPTFYVLDKEVWSKLGITALPVSFLVSPNGEILYKMLGDTDWTSSVTIEFIDSLLASVQM